MSYRYDDIPERGSQYMSEAVSISDSASAICEMVTESDLVSDRLAEVRETVMKHFPHLWSAVEVGLSTCATLLLADNANPVALIYVGPPSAGKTTVVTLFDGAKVNGQALCYRSDKFTPASFVSHSAKATEAALRKVDLLPRIQYKVLLTPELSTIFRGKPDELTERFSTITRVLDGQGLITDSGTHGQRGYKGDYLFAWLGATTPFDPAVWKVMAQLGSRLFFLVMDAVAEATEEELIRAMKQEVPYEEGRKQCKEAVCRFLEYLFTEHKGVRGVEWKSEKNPYEVSESIARCAMLLARMRTPYNKEAEAQHESPHRANAVLYNLARGHALVCGRTELTAEDMSIIRQITLSSVPAHRRAVLTAFARNEGLPLTVKQIAGATGVSRKTAEAIMEEMEWLGLATHEKNGNGKPSYLTLKQEWVWSMAPEFRSFLVQGDLAKNGG